MQSSICRKPCTKPLATIGPPLHFIQAISPISSLPHGTGLREGAVEPQRHAVAADALTGSETLEDIINLAIGLEKKSILFYVGMKDMVPPKYGQEEIEDIIKEERKHVVQLTGILNKVKGR